MKTMTRKRHLQAKSTIVPLAFVMALGASSHPAWAEANAEAKGESLAKEATEAFKSGRYTQAAMLFKQAYAQVPSPSLLFNSARAYQRGGQLREALSLYRLFLTLNTGSDEHAKQGRAYAVDNISEIEKLLAQQARPPKQSSAAKPDPTPTQPAPVPKAKAAPAQPTTKTPTATSPKTASTDASNRSSSKPSSVTGAPKPTGSPAKKQVVSTHLASKSKDWSERKVLAVTLLSASGALVISGIALRLAGASVGDEINSALANSTQVNGVTFYPDAKQREIDNLASRQSGFKTGGNLVLALGLASAAVGGYFWWTRLKDDGALSLSPTWRGDALSWTLSGRF